MTTKDNLMFLAGDDLQREIGRVLNGAKLRCAVAFWGQGAEERIPQAQIKTARLICNLETGATNPFEIGRLMESGAKVRMHPKLHAKVYLSAKGAVVTSSNMSANGLGFEGREQAHWLEAGTSLRDTAAVAKWFDLLWEDEATKPVTAEELEKAKKAWKLRQRFKPSQPSLADVDVKDCPHLCVWWGEFDADYQEESVKRQLGPLDKVKKRLDNGIQIKDDGDRAFLPGRWLLWWKPGRDRLPVRGSLAWIKLGSQIVVDAFRFKDERAGDLYDTVPEAEEKLPPPFLIDDRFREVFRACMARKKYEKLRLDYADEKEGWFTKDRKRLTKSLWVDLKKAYVEQARQAESAT